MLKSGKSEQKSVAASRAICRQLVRYIAFDCKISQATNEAQEEATFKKRIS